MSSHEHTPELDQLDVVIPSSNLPCCSKTVVREEVKAVVIEQEEMPKTRSSQGKEQGSMPEEESLSPRSRRRKESFSPSPKPTTTTVVLKKVKVEIEDDYTYGLEEEAEDSSDESPPPSPRIIPRRNCAEEAKKKIKGEKGEERQQTETGDSREGSCDRSECSPTKVCCLNVQEGCIESATDPSGKNFHHLSKHEHVCVVCYDTIWKASGKFGKKYTSWKAKWSDESRCHPGVKAFIFDQILPYWIQCSSCHKFRKYESETVPTHKFLSSFVCGVCEDPEDSDTQEAKDKSWIYSINACPLLQNTPALFYLRGGHYFYDELGMSPVEQEFKTKDIRTENFMSPFNIPEQQSKAFCLRPDMMEYDEVVAFPEYVVESVFYLAIRNLVVTLWNMNPFEYLTLDKCIPFLICRGLARVWYIHELARIHEFLRIKSIINYGVLELPLVVKEQHSLDVIIVGAGISGLSAARQLRSFGANVKVLEAKSTIGGRMHDDWSLGVAVGCGAQLVTGSINNPIILMCEQTGVKYRIVESQCPLIDGVKGGLVNWKTDKYVEEHLNCVLDALYHWKNSTKHGDASLEGSFLVIFVCLWTVLRAWTISQLNSYRQTLDRCICQLIPEIEPEVHACVHDPGFQSIQGYSSFNT